MKRELASPPMSDAMHQVMANLMALNAQLSDLESELGTWVPDAAKVSAHTTEIRRQFARSSSPRHSIERRQMK
jgi:hypothetical protein